MGDEFLALCAAVATLGLMGWVGYFFLLGRIDMLTAILRSQQTVIDAMLDVQQKADFPKDKP